jgi:hypothetical protein
MPVGRRHNAVDGQSDPVTERPSQHESESGAEREEERRTVVQDAADDLRRRIAASRERAAVGPPHNR